MHFYVIIISDNLDACKQTNTINQPHIGRCRKKQNGSKYINTTNNHLKQEILLAHSERFEVKSSGPNSIFSCSMENIHYTSCSILFKVPKNQKSNSLSIPRPSIKHTQNRWHTQNGWLKLAFPLNLCFCAYNLSFQPIGHDVNI